MRVLVLIFLIIVSGCVETRRIPTTPLPTAAVSQKFGGDTNLSLVASLVTVRAWRIIFTHQDDGPPKPIINRFTKPGPGVLISTNLVAQLTKILIDGHSYMPPDVSDNCIHEPDLLLTFSDGRRTLDVLFCLDCAVMMVRPVEGRFETVDSLLTTPASMRLNQIISQAFPNDDLH